MPVSTNVTIIGAGPYGLSIGAYLRKAGTEFRIVGIPMQSWLENMPIGMHLKSAGLSSTIFDPARAFTLAKYCADQSIPYADVGVPVELETFSNYGLEFQKHLVPNLMENLVTKLDRHPDGFLVRLDDGQSFTSRTVVVAVGLGYFCRPVPELAALPGELVSHSWVNRDLTKYRGRDIVVLGAGASAVDIAVLLAERGARPMLAARRDRLEFNIEERHPRPLWERLARPMSGVGIGWGNKLTADVLPWLYPYLSDAFRKRHVACTLGPAAGWFMKERIKHVPLLLGHHLENATTDGARAKLTFRAGTTREVVAADHVIAATGFAPDAARISFLGSDLVTGIRRIGTAPKLSARFESSVPGLYFVGPSAAASFGPIMRFSLGAGFTSQRLAGCLAGTSHATRDANFESGNFPAERLS